MTQSSRHFLVGCFVLGGFALFALGCILFGGSQIFARKLYFETYFATSVQGLDVGGPVKFRGMRIGTVESVGFAGETYATQKGVDEKVPGVHRAFTYIRVVCSIDLERHSHFSEERIHALIRRGMRAKLGLQGITGVVFINLDLLRDDDLSPTPPLFVPWQPDYPYIPSEPNTLQSVVSVVETLSRKVEDIDLPGAVSALTQLLKKAEGTLSESNVPKMVKTFTTLGENLDRQVARIDALLGSLDTKQMSTSMQALLNNLSELSQGLNAELKAFRARTDVNQMSGELSETLSTLSRTSASLEALVEEIRDRPSRLFFDSPEE